MKNTRQRNFALLSLAALAAVAMTLSLSNAPARAQATTTTFNFTEPVPPTTVGTCDGFRLIALSGDVHFVMTFNESASGNQHFRFEMNYQGVSGVDQFGNQYSVSANNSDTAVFNADTQSSESIVQYFRLIGQGQTPNQRVRNVSHITINNNGEPTAVFDHFDAECN